jgi:phosphoesterase RecJ-like protein
MEVPLENDLKDVAARIAESRRPLLIGHVRADADCAGSLSALAITLRMAGRQPTVAIQRALVPPKMMRLFALAGVEPTEQVDLAPIDLVIVLDTAASSRVNIACGAQGLADKPVVVIDHHASNDRFGSWNYVVDDASSTCELVVDLLEAMNAPITPVVATMLYAGVYGDTGGFSLPNTTPRSLQIASKLAAAGANIADLCQFLERSQTRSEFNLLRLVYDNTHLSENGRVAWSTLTYDEIASTGCNHADIDDQVAVPRSLEGPDVAILFSEGLPRSIRLNIRSEGDVDVLPLAREFGGGGHHSAAGTSIKNQPFDEVVKRVVDRTLEYLEERYPMAPRDRNS